MDDDGPAAVRAAAVGLGALRQHRRDVRASDYDWQVFWTVIVTVAGEAWGAFLLSRASEPWLQFVLVLMMLGGIGYAAVIIGVVRNRAADVGPVDVYEFDGGLVRTTTQTTAVFPWGDCVVWENIHWSGGSQGGQSMHRAFNVRRIDHSGQTEQMPLSWDVDRISALITDATLPGALAAARSSTGVTFGAVTLGPDGITVAGETTPWMRVDRVVRESDEIRVYQRGQVRPWVRRPIGQVPGAPVLLVVAEKLVADLGVS